MSLGVIGAGLPRTGTLSMKAALEELGLGACYHMEEVFKAPWRAKHWERVFRGEPIEWDEVFEGYGATVDAPGCIVWRDLVARYPQAKVILTLRDRDAWCESMYKTVLSERHQAAIATSAVAPMFEAMAPRFMQIAGWPSPPADAPPGPPPKEMLIALYEGQKAAVIREVAPERLLVFDVREGWEPLCGFLGVEAPASPFPRVNDSGSFHDNFPSAAI